MAAYIDILGTVFSVPDPDVVTRLSGIYRTTAVDLSEARSQLAALIAGQWEADWTGRAAEAFTSKIAALPGQLAKAELSFGAAALALSDYANQLWPVISALNALVNDGDDAEGTLRATVAAREQVIMAGQDPQVTGWNTRLSEAEAGVAAIRQRCSALRAYLDELSAQCVSQLQAASAEGIQNNPITDFQRYVLQDALIPYAQLQYAGLRLAVTIGDDLFVSPIEQFVTAAKNYEANPSLHTLGILIGDYAGALGVVAMFVPGLAPLLIGLYVTAAAIDAAAVVEHEPGATLSQVRSDAFNAAFGLATAGMGRVLDVGVARDRYLLINALGHDDSAQLEDLATGADARVSADALQSAGMRHFFSPQYVSNAETQSVTLDLPYSPAAVTFQHYHFVLDRASDAVTVMQAEHDKAQQALQQEGQPPCP